MNAGDDRRSAIKKLKTLIYSTKQDIEVFRANLEKRFSEVLLPNHVEVTEQVHSGIDCDLLMPEIYSSRKIMIYIHGGSFVGGSRKVYRGFCSTIAAATSCRVVVPEFHLAPSNAFPQGVEDLQGVFRSVFTDEQIACSLDTSDNKKNDLPEIILCADGSGASMAIALILSLREKFRSCISNLILFSPWLNLSPSSPLINGKKVHDELMTGDCLRCSGDVYTYSGNLENPLVSPIFASVEELAGFPPVYIQMGEKEILLEDVKTFQEILKKAEIPCTLDITKDMMFMFQMADEYLSEAHLAIERIGKLITYKNEEQDPETLNRMPELRNCINHEA